MMQRIRRLLRHRWYDQSNLRRALPPAALERLTGCVRASERRHSGEIRIYIEAGLPTSYLMRHATTPTIIRERALTLFGKLRVWDTEHNNGVLIYLLLAENAIEIVADRGIHRLVAAGQWQTLIAGMATAFRAGQFEEGLTRTLSEVSALLERHFPLAAGLDNPNELPDEPVIDAR